MKFFETCIYFVSVVNEQLPLLKFQPSYIVNLIRHEFNLEDMSMTLHFGLIGPRIFGWSQESYCNVLPFAQIQWLRIILPNFLRTKVPCTLGWPYTERTWLYFDYFIWRVSSTVVVSTCFLTCGCVYVWVLYCVGVCMCGFCNVWVCVCVCVCVKNQHWISKLGVSRQERNNVKNSKL